MSDPQKTKTLIQKIQSARDSQVLCIVTCDRIGSGQQMQWLQQDVVRPAYDLARQMWRRDSKRLDLFIYTRGGDSNFPWSLVSALRETIDGKEFSVLVPYRCHSAGTIIALGADEIVMGPKGELGPIDTTMTSPYNPQHPKTKEPLPISVEDVLGYFSLLDRVGCTGSDGKVQGLREFTRKVHPYALGMVQRLEDQTKLVASQMLEMRLRPFSDAENEAIVSTLAKRINSHNHAISRTEAIHHVGLSNIKKSEDAKIDSPLWDLYRAYEDLMELRTTFYPEDDFHRDPNLDEHEYTGLPACIVETELTRMVCRYDVKMTRVRKPMQSLTIQPQINFPPPALPAGIDAEQFNQAVGQWYQGIGLPIIQATINEAIERARKSTPTEGYQRIEHRRRWELDEDRSGAVVEKKLRKRRKPKVKKGVNT